MFVISYAFVLVNFRNDISPSITGPGLIAYCPNQKHATANL